MCGWWAFAHVAQPLPPLNPALSSCLDSSELVYGVLGARSSLWLSVVQNVFLALVGLGYSITAAEVMRNVARSCCTPGEPCFDSYFVFAIIFGLVQCVLAQTPSMDSMAHMSVIGAATSLAYSLVAIGLSFAAGDGGTHTLRGKELPPLQKMFAVFNAVGLQSSAYVFIMIQVEIFDTIKTDAKGPAWHMSRAINFALLGTTILYVGVAASGYLAFGVDVCHNVLSCVQNPAWAIRMGNILVLIHMVPAYQLYMQPFYQMVERNVRRIKRFPPRLHGWPLRLSFRTAHTVANTIVTIAIPFFGDIIGLVGACTFFPCMYFPLQLYKVVRKPSERVRRTLNIIVVIAFFVTLMSAAGSVQQIVVHSSEYTMFG